MNAGRRAGAVLAALAMAVSAPAAGAATWTEVGALFQARCVLCHQGAAAPRGVRLDTHEAVLKGGERGAVVRTGDLAGSELLRRVRGESLPRMPLTGPPYLSAAEVKLLEDWVRAGMPKAPAAPAGATAATPKPVAAQAKPRSPGSPPTWTDVVPVLATRCMKCHAPQGVLGPPPEGFVLLTWQDAIAAGERARIVPGQPGASELVRRIRGHSLPRMPYDGPPWLSEDEIRLVEAWIRGGARDGDGKVAPMPVGARVRFGGTLDGRWSVDGQPLVVDRRTRIDKSPRLGDRVEVRGRIGPKGEVIVERLRRR